MKETVEVSEGWYLCLRNGKETPMYNDGNGKWHLSAHHTDDTFFNEKTKSPDEVLKKISK